MSTQTSEKGKRSWAPLGWLGLYLFNLLLVLLFQVLFVHTIPRPLTVNAMAKLPSFSGCEVLDVTGENSTANTTGFMGQSNPDFILYRTAAGEVQVVRVEWNLYIPRFRIETNTVQTIPPGSGEYPVTMRDFFGTSNVVVEDQRRITNHGGSGLTRQQHIIQGAHVFWAVLLLLGELYIPSLWRRIRKKLSSFQRNS